MSVNSRPHTALTASESLATDRDSHLHISETVGDQAVADLDMNHVDEAAGNTAPATGGTIGHYGDHLVGDAADSVLADRGTVDIGEVRGDLAGG
ncbi:hypothetical protein [Mycobacterium nebraskense]|uniref:hypothetical protein n=2 Tax=Mycobacterium nebraskense TaxID=244292 RepID=UPI0012E30E99|nr:hypothetical protein [Mycobacterium nebraskense]